MILVTFGKIGLLFSVYNISKNYLTFNNSWIDIYKIRQSVFFSSLVSHLITKDVIHKPRKQMKVVKTFKNCLRYNCNSVYVLYTKYIYIYICGGLNKLATWFMDGKFISPCPFTYADNLLRVEK